MIKATNLRKFFADKAILNDVSVELLRGEVCVLFGPNGSGKTSLCRILSLLDYPDAGTIEVNGQMYSFPLRSSIIQFPYPNVSFVFQQLFLWPHLTNEKNILLAVKESNKTSANLYKKIIKDLQIEDILHRYPNEISVGQKQRIAIARCLVLDPQFIFFDEITSSLDAVQTENTIDIILKLKTKDVGCLIVTHDVERFKKIADRLFFIHNGSLLEVKIGESVDEPLSSEIKLFLQ